MLKRLMIFFPLGVWLSALLMYQTGVTPNLVLSFISIPVFLGGIGWSVYRYFRPKPATMCFVVKETGRKVYMNDDFQIVDNPYDRGR